MNEGTQYENGESRRKITYLVDGDQRTTVRDMVHYDKEDMLTAYDRSGNGVDRFVQIPMHRVVRVDAVDTEYYDSH